MDVMRIPSDEHVHHWSGQWVADATSQMRGSRPALPVTLRQWELSLHSYLLAFGRGRDGPFRPDEAFCHLSCSILQGLARRLENLPARIKWRSLPGWVLEFAR